MSSPHFRVDHPGKTRGVRAVTNQVTYVDADGVETEAFASLIGGEEFVEAWFKEINAYLEENPEIAKGKGPDAVLGAVFAEIRSDLQKVWDSHGPERDGWSPPAH